MICPCILLWSIYLNTTGHNPNYLTVEIPQNNIWGTFGIQILSLNSKTVDIIYTQNIQRRFKYIDNFGDKQLWFLNILYWPTITTNCNLFSLVDLGETWSRFSWSKYFWTFLHLYFLHNLFNFFWTCLPRWLMVDPIAPRICFNLYWKLPIHRCYIRWYQYTPISFCVNWPSISWVLGRQTGEIKTKLMTTH